MNRAARKTPGRETRPPARAARRVATSLLLLALGGCAGGAVPQPPAVDDPAEDDETLVATDLVSALMQLPDASPFATTVQVSPPPTRFGEALVAALRGGGFGIQRVSEDQGRNYLGYRVTRTETEARPVITYALSVGAIDVERDYKRDGELLFPDSAVRVRGVAPARVVVNDDVYRQRGGETVFPSGVVFLDASGRAVERREREVRVSAGHARAAGERVNAERFLVLARANLFLADRLKQSRRPPTALEPFRQTALRFGDGDSLRLGEANKRALARLVTMYDPSTDRFSLTGCSHGKSLLWDGTESMALARSQRVKEELIIAGVASERVYEESCFATRYAERLPPNAVIVTLERGRPAGSDTSRGERT